MSWKYGAIFALGTALWSILALSSTLASEASRGSLDFVAATPFGKRRIALEKLAAHLTMLCLALAILTAGHDDQLERLRRRGPRRPDRAAVAPWASPCGSGFIALFFGGLAFALGPLLGRSGAAGVAGIVMIVLWVANGLDLGGPLAAISPFRWTADHIALVGEYDWAGLALVGIVAAVFLAIGVELFSRRDLGITAGLSLPALPAAVLGVRGPISRAFGEQLPRALSWGIGLGLMGALLASLVGPMADQIAAERRPAQDVRLDLPGLRPRHRPVASSSCTSSCSTSRPASRRATLVAKWASDETDGRLDSVLATPLGRARWVIAGGIAAILGIVVMSVLFAAGIGLGAASGGVAAGDAMLGSTALGLFAVAMVGVGVAVGGLWRTSLAAEIAALVVIVTYLIDLLAPALKLPDWVHQLALTAHLGQPMIGAWDPVGVVACIVIAVGGIALGAWGFAVAM